MYRLLLYCPIVLSYLTSFFTSTFTPFYSKIIYLTTCRLYSATHPAPLGHPSPRGEEEPTVWLFDSEAEKASPADAVLGHKHLAGCDTR